MSPSFNASTTEGQIIEMALVIDEDTGDWLHGRRRIAKQFGVSEWYARKIIDRARRGVGGTNKLTPEQVKTKIKEKEILKVPEIVLHIPSRVKVHRPDTTVEQWVIASDFHAPDYHGPSCSILYQIIEDINPNKVFLLGDLFTLDEFSRYDKPPTHPSSWVEDFAAAGEILGSVAAASSKDTELVWVMGNHEERLKKYLMRRDPLLYDVLNIEKMFRVIDMEDAVVDWSFEDRSEIPFRDLNLVIGHGDNVRKHSGMSGFARLDELFMSVVVGHSHRQGLYFKNTGRSRYFGEQNLFALENGCMCEYSQEYTHGRTTNWQHGFSVLSIDKSGKTPIVEPALVTINNSRTVFRGKTYIA